MAVGAREIMRDGKDAIIMRVGHGRKHAKIVIKLDPSDTYSVRYVEIKGGQIVKDETVEMVYCDNLGDVVRGMVK